MMGQGIIYPTPLQHTDQQDVKLPVKDSQYRQLPTFISPIFNHFFVLISSYWTLSTFFTCSTVQTN